MLRPALQTQTARSNLRRHFVPTLLATAVASTVPLYVSAQDAAPGAPPALEEIVVKGIRASLASAVDQERDSNNLIEVIVADDIGKLPDQNLAEVLENIPGVQITREAGVGTGVQIRGTNSNRTEINGVSTVGSGSGRTGIDFDDVSAAIISAVEVVKAPDASTIEGSVGGTINLKTIRPLDLEEQLAYVRLQGEHSSLSEDGNITPRASGTWGNNWDSDYGEFGIVISGSYAEQDVSSFRPRADRDNLVTSDSGVPSAEPFDYLPIQFLVQDYDNYKYETSNFVGTMQWKPNDNLMFYFDGVYNDQDRKQESSRVQASGVSDLKDVQAPDTFQSVNFGSKLGSINAGLTGVIPVEEGGADPNLRMSTDTSSRQSTNEMYSFGTDWSRGRFSGKVEVSTSINDTDTPAFDTTLNFINPNVATNSSNENGTPFEYDLRGALAFDVADGVYGSPTTEQLLDPANYMLRDVNQARDHSKNTEDAFRTDFAFDLDWGPVTTIDFGYRYNETRSKNNDSSSNVGLRTFDESPTGNLFASILKKGPDNFGDGDGRDLYVKDFLVISAGKANDSPQEVLDVLNQAIVENNAITGADRGPIDEPTSTTAAFFDITEETDALYAQANFDYGIFRGNLGMRYVDTSIKSKGNSVVNDEVTPTTSTSSYDYWLPRFNLVAEVREDVLLRAGWSKDIRRPDFDQMSTSAQFDTSPNPAVDIGNPALKPEEVESYDLGAEWYFADASVVSVALFYKDRKDLHVDQQESPVEDPVTGYRDTSPPCEGGGIFNPIADINVFGPEPGVGVCVPIATTVNGDGETTQKGVELAFQYDLAQWEDKLGWASGFGVIANYTWQEFSGGETYQYPTSRAEQVFTAMGNSDYRQKAPLLDLSENAYNFTLYYEKYGISARARYTWRDNFRSDDFGSTNSLPWGFYVVQEDRSQLNASINYSVNDHLDIGLEAVNITEEKVNQTCVNQGALLCFQGFADRRITFGAAYRF
ncbi:MAG: TonB-dependent receptor [Pseudomonadales bacterium]|nr:TonB-dependent receptor [Pseudomonadales bacterium]